MIGCTPGGRGGDRELHRAEQVAGIGDRDRRHAVLLAQVGQVLGADRALGQRVGGMDAEMDESRHAAMGHLIKPSRADAMVDRFGRAGPAFPACVAGPAAYQNLQMIWRRRSSFIHLYVHHASRRATVR